MATDWLVGWNRRLPITSQNAKVAEAITNGYYDLSLAPAAFWDHVKNGGGDIRVTETDGITEVAREIVSCDTGTDTGEIHFDCTGIQTGSDVTWYIYYGNAAANDYAEDAMYGREAVWDANYQFVFHLEESAGVALDSTSNDHDGTFAGTLPDSQAGMVGRAQDMDGLNDYFHLADSSDWVFGEEDWAIECWVKFSAIQVARLFCFSTNSDNRTQMSYDNNDGGLTFRCKAGGVPQFPYKTFAWVPIQDTKYHIALVRDGNTVTAYIDNGSIGTLDVTGVDFPDQGTIGLRIGRNTYSATSYMPGLLDEYRLTRGVVRSVNWRTTTYNNQDDPGTFWSTGAVENESRINVGAWQVRNIGAWDSLSGEEESDGPPLGTLALTGVGR